MTISQFEIQAAVQKAVILPLPCCWTRVKLYMCSCGKARKEIRVKLFIFFHFLFLYCSCLIYILTVVILSETSETWVSTCFYFQDESLLWFEEHLLHSRLRGSAPDKHRPWRRSSGAFCFVGQSSRVSHTSVYWFTSVAVWQDRCKTQFTS